MRMEPVCMILGQSAGTAGTIAIEKDIPVQQVNYEVLKRELLSLARSYRTSAGLLPPK